MVGSSVVPPYAGPDDWARFVAQVVAVPGGPFLWLAPPRDDGYGQFWVDNRPFRAHRWAWMAWHGPLAAGTVVRHRCDEPLCVPTTREAVLEHLAVGTQADNVVDRDTRGRGARVRWGLRGWAVDRRGMAERSRALHQAVTAALAAGATPADLPAVIASVSAAGATLPGQAALF